MRRFAPVVLILFLSSPLLAGDYERTLERATPNSEAGYELEKPVKAVAMPIPLSNPTIGTGLGLAVMTIYNVDEGSPDSSTILGGLYTNSDSWLVGLAQDTYLKDDEYRVNAALGYGDMNLKFYGIGYKAGSLGIYLPINQKFAAFIPGFQAHVGHDIYLGARLRYLQVNTDFDLKNLGYVLAPQYPYLHYLPRIELNSVTSGLGLLVSYDTRDNKMNASDGIFIDLSTNWAAKSLGSDNTYQIYEGAFNLYEEVAPTHVLAYRLYGRLGYGDVPFYDLSMFGSMNDLRGYVGGQYRDKMMLATQLEYRWQFHERVGLVSFLGVGRVAHKVSDFKFDKLLPSLGFGLRYMAETENRVNMSIDLAWGKDDYALYFAIGEAF